MTTDWGYIDAGHYDEMVAAVKRDPGIRSTFGTKVAKGESITNFSSTKNRIFGPCTVITTVHRDGGIDQRVQS